MKIEVDPKLLHIRNLDTHPLIRMGVQFGFMKEHFEEPCFPAHVFEFYQMRKLWIELQFIERN